MKKPKEEKFDLPKDEQAQLIRELINQFKKDWMAAKVQEHIYSLEYAKPVHITKAVALENMGTYQTRMRYCFENIVAFEHYANAQEIKL